MKEYKKVESRKVAFLGLGVMGYPIARHLKNAGHSVTVYNRTTAKAEAWVKDYGQKMALTPREAAENADIVFCCVGNDDDLRSVIYGENGALAGMKAGSVFVDNTTDSANVAREMYAAFKQRGCSFIDAPVSGGQAGAENGVLTVMCGGDEEVFNSVREVIDAYACAVTYMGAAGNGQLTKMVNQIAIAGVLQGLSEAVAFGINADLDMPKVLDVIGKGAAGSWQMKERGPTMLENRYNFGFAVDWMRKDLKIALEEAARNGSKLPMTESIDGYYAQIQANGGNRLDTSSLITLLPRKDVK